MAVRVSKISRIINKLRKDNYNESYRDAHQLQVLDYFEMALELLLLEDKKTISEEEFEMITIRLKEMYKWWTDEIIERIKNEL